MSGNLVSLEVNGHEGNFGNGRSNEPGRIILELVGLFLLSSNYLVVVLSKIDSRRCQTLKRDLVGISESFS